MKAIHYFIIGFLMLLFIWITLIVEGKKNKGKGDGAKKFGDDVKKFGKKAFDKTKEFGKKVIKKTNKKVGKPVKKAFKPPNKDCKRDWSKCKKTADDTYQNNPTELERARNVCHLKYKRCT